MARDYRFDQHFLANPRVVAELIGHSNIRKNDLVYDLGAGSGVISSVLARRAKYVVAVEIEQSALKKLRENMQGFENVKVVEQDILAVRPTGAYKIFSNIPFSQSANVVKRYCFKVDPPKAMYLIVQKQFARKLVPGNDHFTSQLSAELAPWYNVRVRKPLRKSDFTPPPAVDTVLIEIKPHEHELLDHKYIEHYRKFIEQCFSRQKYFGSLNREAVGISAEKIPSQLSLEQWVRLFSSIAR